MATMGEKRVGIRELKSNLSEHLRRVKAGEVVVVTDHGRAVARIVPEPGSTAERLDQLVKAGVLSWSGRKLRLGKPLVRTLDAGSVADLVSEGRD